MPESPAIETDRESPCYGYGAADRGRLVLTFQVSPAGAVRATGSDMPEAAPRGRSASTRASEIPRAAPFSTAFSTMLSTLASSVIKLEASTIT